MTHASPFHGFSTLKKIAPQLKELDQIPLFGNAPPFDWERFSSLTASQFGVQSLKIHPVGQEWREAETLRVGLGGNVIVFPLDIAPLNGSVYWMMSRKDVAKLTSWMLNGKSRTKALASDILQEGFYRYLMLEIMDAALNVEPLSSFTPILNEEAPLPDESAFCIDIEIDFDRSSCFGRFVIPNLFRQSWVQFFSHLDPDRISPKLAQSLELTLAIQTGHVLLGMSEWEKVKKGDFVLLDRGSYDPKNRTGLATLTINATPLFQVKIKQNKIELLDYAFIYEDATDMEKKNLDEQTFRNAPEGERVALQDVPIYVTVELSRIRMTLEQLMKLSPGNLLEIPVQPDQVVSLTVGGSKVGNAELVHLGESLGIRILDLG